jgi:ATP-dependent Clp protease ATP-binding subunit ClpA
MNAFSVVGIVIALAALIIGADKVNHLFTVVIFIASLAGIIAAIIIERRKVIQASAPNNKIDYENLINTKIQLYLPWLKENVRGHNVVIDSIIQSMQEEITLARSGRILGAYLLAGPTGTGKTFLSTLIAQALYPKSQPIILRMNQLKHPDDVFTIIGPPPGRQGYEVGGALTRPVLENPYRVIILDELDKCHPDIHHCLYDILDAGQCREKSSGKLVDFSACTFFATTNAGIEKLRSIQGSDNDFNKKLTQSRDALVESAGFDKAFLARWTRIEFMDSLSPVHVAEVALIQLCQYWKEYGIEVSYVPPEILLEAIDRNEEFKSYGVRQLATYIRTITNPAISEARKTNITKVLLGVSDEGEVVVWSRS